MSLPSIRTVQVIDTYFPLVDGVIQTVNNYATYLNPDCPTAVVFPQQLGAYDYDALPYPVHALKQMRMRFSEYALPGLNMENELTAFLDEFRPELIHVHSPFFTGQAALRYAKKKHIPSVATFHSKYYDDAINMTGSRQIARVVADYVVRNYNKATQVWACSAGTADTFRSYGYTGEIFVMDNGSSYNVPAERRPVLQSRAAEAFGIPTDGKLLLFVGHQIWHKNIKLVLDTVKLLLTRDPSYRLLIAGEGYDGEAIRAYAEKLAFPDGAVRFLGKIADRDLLAGVMLSADLFFFPSVYDNSPLVVRESASLGLPSLLTEGSNAAEVIVKDFSGFTAAENPAAMADEIQRIFASPELLAKVRRNAEQTAKSWPEIVDTVHEKYCALIETYRSTKKKRKKDFFRPEIF